jgi:hypothetical protein
MNRDTRYKCSCSPGHRQNHATLELPAAPPGRLRTLVLGRAQKYGPQGCTQSMVEVSRSIGRFLCGTLLRPVFQVAFAVPRLLAFKRPEMPRFPRLRYDPRHCVHGPGIVPKAPLATCYFSIFVNNIQW